MKNRNERVHLTTLFVVQLAICILTLISTAVLTNRLAGHTTEVLSQQALKISEERMRERVESTLITIGLEQEKTLSRMRALGKFCSDTIAGEPEEITAQYIAALLSRHAWEDCGRAMQVLLHDDQTQSVTLISAEGIEDVSSLYADKASVRVYALSQPFCEIITRDHLTIHIFAGQNDLDRISKDSIYEAVHGMRYSGDGYVWVNEVLNYAGGDSYAVRVIHPHLKNAEGQYLSTATEDAGGGLPYLAELNGIKENGEIFHTYHLIDPDSGQVYEKAAYAMLYEPYDWIVCAGAPLDTIFSYNAELEDYNRQVLATNLRSSVLLLVAVFVFGIVLIISSNRKYSGALRAQMEESAKQNEQLFNVVAQHSNRILYAYDLASGTTRPWNEENAKSDILSHLYTGNYSEQALKENEGVLPDCFDDVRRFFADIHAGVPSGETNIHIRLLDGQKKWYHFKYSSIFEQNVPVTALISIADITTRHEQELAHLRHIQTIEDEAEGYQIFVECDLTADQVEYLSGQMLSAEEKAIRCAYSDLGRELLNLKFRHEDFAGSSRYFSCENLLELYARGKRKLITEWKVRYNDYQPHWLAVEIVLLTDPYNRHVKATICMWDITEAHREKQAILQRADYDAMTGLLRKDAGEAQIKKLLETENEKGGILIALDLDDLKGINDTLGHKQGDAAIIGIGETMKHHFRSGDILVRAGGDEFIAFLPGAGQSKHAVEASVSLLLKKLAGISIGENNERTLRCSVGCAVERPGEDSYDSLFKRADTALYHVKRNEKNNFAFYVPEMEEADFEFRSKALQAGPESRGAEQPELQHLLDAIIDFFQLTLSVNLSRNSYHTVEEPEGGAFAALPPSGSLDELMQLAAGAVCPDDPEDSLAPLSGEALLQAWESGRRYVQHELRLHDQGRCRRIRCMAVLYKNEEDEVCGFILLRRDDEPAGRAI